MHGTGAPSLVYPDPPTKNRERVWTKVHRRRVPEECAWASTLYCVGQSASNKKNVSSDMLLFEHDYGSGHALSSMHGTGSSY